METWQQYRDEKVSHIALQMNEHNISNASFHGVLAEVRYIAKAREKNINHSSAYPRERCKLLDQGRLDTKTGAAWETSKA